MSASASASASMSASSSSSASSSVGQEKQEKENGDPFQFDASKFKPNVQEALGPKGCVRSYLLLRGKVQEHDLQKREMKKNLDAQAKTVKKWFMQHHIGKIDVADYCLPQDQDRFRDWQLGVRYRASTLLKKKYPLTETQKMEAISKKIQEVYGQQVTPAQLEEWVEIQQVAHNYQVRSQKQNEPDVIQKTIPVLVLTSKKRPRAPSDNESGPAKKRRVLSKESKEEEKEEKQDNKQDYRENEAFNPDDDTVSTPNMIELASASDDEKSTHTAGGRSPSPLLEMKRLELQASPLRILPPAQPPLRIMPPPPAPASLPPQPTPMPSLPAAPRSFSSYVPPILPASVSAAFFLDPTPPAAAAPAVSRPPIRTPAASTAFLSGSSISGLSHRAKQALQQQKKEDAQAKK